MLLPTMLPREIFDAIEKDSRKLYIRKDKIYPKVVKFFRKAKAFPASYVDEYLIPSTNNKHIAYYYARNYNEAERPAYQFFTEMFDKTERFIIKTVKMGYNHTPESKTVMLPIVEVYTSHFFQRYNERFLHKENIRTNEIAGLYFIRNGHGIPVELNDKINRNFKDYGDSNTSGVKVNDGFCFVRRVLQGNFCGEGPNVTDKVEAMIMFYMTFMNESSMSDTQIKAINEKYREVLYYNMKVLSNISRTQRLVIKK